MSDIRVRAVSSEMVGFDRVPAVDFCLLGDGGRQMIPAGILPSARGFLTLGQSIFTHQQCVSKNVTSFSLCACAICVSKLTEA